MATRHPFRQTWTAIRIMVVMTLVLGVGYTAVVTAIGQLALPAQANGALVRDADGAVVGSARLGQGFVDEDGAALPQWFQSRPSAAGDGWDGGASSGSNLGPSSDDLLVLVEERRAAVAELEGVAPEAVPVDAVTASGSGLDPHISPEYAALQVPRVAAERGLAKGEVAALVAEHTTGRDLGVLGEPVVNVLELNLALAALAGRGEAGSRVGD